MAYWYTLYSGRGDMGLGTYAQISFTQARELLAKYQALVAQEIHLIKYRQKAAIEASRVDTSFDTIAKITFEAKSQSSSIMEKRGGGSLPQRCTLFQN